MCDFGWRGMVRWSEELKAPMIGLREWRNAGAVGGRVLWMLYSIRRRLG